MNAFTNADPNSHSVESTLNPTSFSTVDGPMPLHRAVPRTNAYPVASLGEELSAVVHAIQQRVQSPIELCAQSTLAVVAMASQAIIDVRLPHGEIRGTSLSLISIASSGERKSATDRICMRPVETRQRDLRRQFLEEASAPCQTVAEPDEPWFREVGNIVVADFANGSKRKKKPRKAPKPQNLRIPTIVVANATQAGLLRTLEGGQSALGLMSDEGGIFIGGSGMSPSNALKTATIMSKMWDGAPFDIASGNKDPVWFVGRRLTSHLMMQPEVAETWLNDRIIQGQGLFSRMLIAAPQSLAGTRLFQPISNDNEATIARFQAKMLTLLEMPARFAPGSESELEPRVVSMTDEAEALWVEFYNRCELQMGPEGRLFPIAAFANKAGEHAARLAAVIAFFANPEVCKLGKSAMARGIELVEWYIEEALRISGVASVPRNIQLAIELAHWLHNRWPALNKSAPHIVSLVDIYQNGPNAIRVKGVAEPIVEVLLDHGWLKRILGGIEVRGKRRRDNVFEIVAAQSGSG